MSLVRVTLVATLLFVGVPLLMLAAAAAGTIGWIVVAAVLPVVVLGVILWLGWFRRQDDDGPYDGP